MPQQKGYYYIKYDILEDPMFKSKVAYYSLFASFAVALAGGAFLYMHQHQGTTVTSKPAPIPADGIVDFNYARDHEYISSVFEDEDNWYWLVDGTRADFSPEDMMKTMSSSRNLATKGNLTIKVLYANGKPAGFSAYFMKNFYLGKIRFIYVDKEHRGAGYGLKLVTAAMEDLKSRGATKISLVTRSTNLAAMRIYEKAGFTLLPSPEGFADFAKIVG